MSNDAHETLSVTRLAMLAACPEQYRRRYVKRDRGQQNATTAAGTAIHAAAELTEGAAANGLEVDVLTAALMAYRATPNLFDLRVFGKKTPAWWMDQGLSKLTDSYHELRRRDRSIGMELESTELHLETERLQGYVDQVLVDAGGELVVRDLKAGKPKPWHAFQVEVYLYLLRQERGDVPARGQLAYLGGGDGPLRLETVLPSMDPMAMWQTLTAAGHAIRLLHEGAGAAMTGIFNDACGLCDYRSSCPAGQVGQVNVEVGR